jgi:peptidyl-prolyl cis-trans isomerase B (cyclophilin B)
VALRQIERTGQDGRGMAVVGLAIGYVVTVLLALFLILAVASIVDVSNAAPAPVVVALSSR